MEQIQTIVAAVDFSIHSDRALEIAIDLGRRFGAGLHVVHAFGLPLPLVSPYEVAAPDAYLKESRDAAGLKLAAAADQVSAAGLQVETHLTEVPAAPAIARVAEEVGADLIVMGTRGHTGLKHFVLGSVAERTLRVATCSVLTVKGGAD